MAGRWTARRVPEKAMYRAGWWLSWAIGIGACFAAGCHLPKPRKPYPPDPLFESKQPLQRTTRPTERPTLLASAIPDPRPPQFPQVLLASPFVPPPPPPDHVRDIFAADRAPPAPAPASPALPAAQTHPRSTDGAEESAAPPPALGHAEDYHWLVGVLDKHYDGRFMLRYAARCGWSRPRSWLPSPMATSFVWKGCCCRGWVRRRPTAGMIFAATGSRP
jgi:hypothetical protein